MGIPESWRVLFILAFWQIFFSESIGGLITNSWKHKIPANPCGRDGGDREWYNSCISYINPLVYINFWPYPYTFLAQRRNLWCKLKGGVVAYWYVSRLLDLPVLGLILGPGPLHRSFWGAADCTVNTVQIKKENTIGSGWLLKADQLTCSSNIKGSRKYGSDPDTWDRAWLIAASAFIPSVGQKRAPE